MKILFAVWEIAPFFKVGGLGDVARALPGALKELGIDIRVIIPYYNAVKFRRYRKHLTGKLYVEYAGRKEKVEIFQLLHPLNQFPVIFLKNKRYLDTVVSGDTFAFFDKTVVEIVARDTLDFYPDVIHCNDNHAGLIPLLVKEYGLKCKTLLTLHNLAHQGAGKTELFQKMGINFRKSSLVRWEIKTKQVNSLMEGIIHADAINAVSPTYAKEILTEEYGMGLEEVLRGKEARVFGILNGINLNQRYIKKIHPMPFYKADGRGAINNEDLEECISKKKIIKRHLQRSLGLKVNEKIPMFCFIGRLDPNQKGLDILHKMLRRLDLEKYQFVLLGSGNTDWEERFGWLSTFYPKNISCKFVFDEELAYRIYASADFIVVPSKYEPCGLIQMIAMSFGTIPVARKTGGLKDSVMDGVNGYLFEKYSSVALEHAIKKASGIYKNDFKRHKEMIRGVLVCDFTWKKSAEEYLRLYERLVNNTI